MSESERVDLITDVLLGAAHADGKMDGSEAAAVKALVGELTSDAAVLARTQARIAAFSAASFDVKAAGQAFAADSDAQKRHLLELVGKVNDADGELDLDEDSYLRELGSALGLAADAYGDLTLDYTVEEQQANFEGLLDVPSPGA